MDLSFPDTEDIQVIIKFTSTTSNVGLWSSFEGSTAGHKIFRASSLDNLNVFIENTTNLKVIDIHRSTLKRLPEVWTLASNTYSTIKVRIFCPSKSLKDMLPPWLDGVKTPPMEKVYPPGETVYPPIEQVFSGLWFDPSRIKIIIIGQDPYHQPGEAHGLAFSCRSGYIPPSLRNIYDEIQRTHPKFNRPDHGDLTGWFHQGVVMINSAFSVKEGEPNSLKKEWEEFSKQLFIKLNRVTGKGVVVMAWGNDAKKRASGFVRATILQSSHPSPLGFKAPPVPFFENSHFIRANNHLVSTGQTPIDWNKM